MHAIGEVLQFLSRDDPAQMLGELESRFLSPGVILETDLSAIGDGILDESSAQFLNYMPSLTRAARQSEFGRHPRLNTLSTASDYLRTLYIGVPIEQFYLLCLDGSGKMLECPLLQKGTIDQTPFYLGHLLQSVVSIDAEAVVLCHNHPGGTLRPSQADIQCTLDALRALYPLRVMMLDHIVIANHQAVSLRDNGYISADLWLRQAPESKLLRNWLG